MGLSARKRIEPRPLLFLLALILVTNIMACGQNGFISSPTSPATASSAPEAVVVRPVPPPAPQNEELAICSNLALKEVVWPLALDHSSKRSMALGLNLSGSFEGSNGWKNITNNFDGQGLSLGLLNQCLGQGSLQPLLVKMRDRQPENMKLQFATSHYASLLAMLSKWQGVVKTASDESDVSESGQGDETLRPDGRLSDLDQLPDGSDGRGSQESVSSDSVLWAKSALYTDGGTTFQSVWKKELQSLSAHPSYVSIQIEAALGLHSRAIGYMKTLGLHELRSYLFLFDINVQNGSLYSSDIAEFKKQIPATSTADETTRLKKILDIRLTHVVEKYRNDVKARKLSIINGSGVVHGASRNYEKEYCFSDGDKLL